MLETKEQKQYLVTALVLIIVLGFVSFWSNPPTPYKENINFAAKRNQAVLDANAYLRYLEGLKVDPKASQQLFQQLITEEDVKKEINQTLKVDQEVKPPVISDKAIAVSNKSGQEAVVDYLSSTTGLAMNFENQTGGLAEALFTDDKKNVDRLTEEYNDMYEKLSKIETPNELVPIQKILLSSFASYGEMLEVSRTFAENPSKEPWPDVYKTYAVVNDQSYNYRKELNKVTDKYKIADLAIMPYYAESSPEKFQLVKTAHAFLGIGDVTITVGDIPRLIMDAIEKGLEASLSKFMSSFLEKMITKIESNYMVANFLYYSDALLSGQYVNDYMNKYVNGDLDQQLIKKFIPQFSCYVPNQNLRPIFQAKATSYLGFEPNGVDPNDPDYYQKMARVGNFLAAPTGWQLYYNDIANEVKSESEKAAEKELSSPGLKTPRDTTKTAITMSINNIVSAQRAGFNSMLQLGISTAKNIIAKMVTALTETLMNKFVFKGASTNAAVLKEQSTCLAAGMTSPVLPAATSNYQEPPPPPNQEQLIEQECQKNPNVCQTTTTDSYPYN